MNYFLWTSSKNGRLSAHSQVVGSALLVRQFPSGYLARHLSRAERFLPSGQMSLNGQMMPTFPAPFLGVRLGPTKSLRKKVKKILIYLYWVLRLSICQWAGLGRLPRETWQIWERRSSRWRAASALIGLEAGRQPKSGLMTMGRKKQRASSG